MRRREFWAPRLLITWALVAGGLLATLWQGWDCTGQYLATPVRVEDQFVSLGSLPPIQLSLCKVFNIDPSNNSLVPATDGTVPIFANSTETFWRELATRGVSFRLAEVIEEIGYWNDSTGGWDVLYGRTTTDSSLLLDDLTFYPYEGNSILLCHTLQPGLASLGTTFRLISTAAAETRE